MSYVGIHGHEEEVTRLLHHAEERGADALTLPGTHPDVNMGVAIESREQLQVSRSDETLCLTDGRPFSAEGPESRWRENYADTIIAEWAHQGTDLFTKRDITASLTISEATSGRLILARAENGTPPIFFAKRQDAFLWSNNIKLLLRHDVTATLDQRALDAYLTLGYVPSPWTFFSEIRKIPAGKYLDWSDDDWTFKRHWEPTPKTRSVHNIETRTAQFKKHLCESLDRLVEGHDQVGVLLSGGVDSSLLLGLLHCELGVDARAFTFEYSDYQGRFNEYDRAHRLTRRYDIPHHPIHYSGEWLKDNLEEAVREYEEPFTYGHHTAQLKEVAESDVTLLINGVKGSAQHISRTANYALRIEGALAERCARIGKLILEKGPLPKLSRLLHALDIMESSPSDLFYRMPFDRVLPDSVRRRLYADQNRVSEGKSAVLSLFEKEVQEVDLHRKSDRICHLHNKFSVCDHYLWWNYRWTRAYELEMAAPFLMPKPRRFMESLRQPFCPPRDESVQKTLARHVAATVMPDEIAYSEKIAQTAPLWVWFRGPLYSLLQEYLRPSKVQEDGLFDAEVVKQEVKKHVSGTGNQPYLVWSLLCFMVWKRTFLESNDF